MHRIIKSRSDGCFEVEQPFESAFQFVSSCLLERDRKDREMIDESKNIQTSLLKASRPLPNCERAISA